MKQSTGAGAQRPGWKKYLFLHLCIFWYTGTTILSKVASDLDFLSLPYLLCYGGIVAVLGIYAILWQQAIKGFKPSVAYSNKSVNLIWTLIVSALLFGEQITWNNLAGAALIILGVCLVVQDD